MTTPTLLLPRKAMRFRPGRDRISYVTMWALCQVMWRVLVPAMLLTALMSRGVL